MPLRIYIAALLLGLLITGCASHTGYHDPSKPEKARLLPSYEFISNVNVIEAHGDGSGLSEQVFSLVRKRLREKTEMQLKKLARWKEGEDITLHLEIEHIRLRKTPAVLLLWAVSGEDEMRVKVWVTKEGEVIAEDAVSTRLGQGGLYQTWGAGRRLELLADQIARKVVHTRL